jgi:hypothetical protein
LSDWATGRCIGTEEYDLRTNKKATHLTQFRYYDNDSGGGTWSYVNIDKDLLSDKWELVPQAPVKDGVSSDLQDTIRSVMIEFLKSDINCLEPKDLTQNLSMMVHEATEAYKSEDPTRVMGSVLYGLASLVYFRHSEKYQEYLKEREKNR